MENYKNNLEKIILEKIKRGEVKPKPRIFFVLKNILFWIMSALFVFFGSISFASILYKISGDYFIIKKIISDDIIFSENILFILPFFWILLLFVFIFLAIKNYKKTRLYYRINIYLVVSVATTVSFVTGLLMFNFGLAQKTEEFSEKYIPFYNKYLKIQEVKKNIFIKKLKEIGVTKEMLENNPELKQKVEDKFDKNVLGKIYLYKKPDICLKESFKCESDEIFFSNKKGCGCREVHFNFEK